MTNDIRTWNGTLDETAVELLLQPGRMVVAPTKVGYIVVTSDRPGLDRKFAAKQRPLSKPGVVLCGSLEQFHTLAETNDEIAALYQTAWNRDVLLGCILPWRASGQSHIPDDGTRELIMDARQTSCFVIKFGTPSEMIVQALWGSRRRLAFASSANPSGKGNSGRVAGVGSRIIDEADLVTEADDYVRSIQPNESVSTRYEQGVMVSMVDAEGGLIPRQLGARAVHPSPTIIRRGLALAEIMLMLSAIFPSWDYRHGTYY